MARARPALSSAKIDLTPMIDVTFLLLIFFLCTLSYRVLEGRLETHLPKDVGIPRSDIVSQLEPLVIALEPDPRAIDGLRIVAGRRVVVNAAALGDFVRQSRASDPEIKVTLRVNADVTHGQVVTVVDALVAHGQEEIMFAPG